METTPRTSKIQIGVNHEKVNSNIYSNVQQQDKSVKGNVFKIKIEFHCLLAIKRVKSVALNAHEMHFNVKLLIKLNYIF